jgi:methyltransferase-like protein/SAM-dependent methyltransferase
MSITSSYDDVLYPGYVHPQTHPDRLAVLATLYGMQPAPVPGARILELACGQGSNIIPLAVSYPNSTCLGIDLSARQIASGMKVVQDLGLTNIELRTQSILDFPDDAGQFDYIIAHGVFSWVPEPVRDRILKICRDHLAPQGVAIVSYNTFPGWHQRRMIRDMMLFHTRSFTEPEKRIQQAKAFLHFMTKAIPDDSAYGRSLHEEFRSLSNVDEAYLAHEQLEEVNEPVYFHEFAKQAQGHSLQYLSEIELGNMQLERYPAQVAEVLANMEIIEREQYLDFLMRRTFRQTLLCHTEVQLDRNNLSSRLAGLRISSGQLAGHSPDELRNNQPLVFQGPNGAQLTINDALVKAAFIQMGQAWPDSIGMNDLQASVRREIASGKIVVQSQTEFQQDSLNLTHSLAQAFVFGLVELHTAESTFANTVTEQPLACALARYQASTGARVTNRRHSSVMLDPINCFLLTQLDGTQNKDQLLQRLVQYVIDHQIALQLDGQVVSSEAEIQELLRSRLEPGLEQLQRQALLVK